MYIRTIMPRGRSTYALGNSLVVRDLPCGRSFSGDERYVKAQTALHSKRCERCKKCDHKELEFTWAEPDSTHTQIRAMNEKTKQSELKNAV